jgi:hypothetical protein
MEKLNKYKKQIVIFVTIFLLATYGIFPALTAANTLLNLVGGIGGLVLLVWAGLELKEYVTSTKGEIVDTNELEEVAKMAAKPKVPRKPKTTKSEYPLEPHAKVVKRVSKTIKTK